MRFEASALQGVVILEQERKEDERGFFARTWCAEEFRRHRLNPVLSQCSVSFNRCKGTLRGMHFQRAPHAEAKLVLCTAGAVFDVVIDLRPDSPTFKKWTGLTLSRENGRMIYVPEGCAHGFQTLVRDTEVYYHISVPYAPAAYGGVRWDDPAFGIRWPEIDSRIISDRDRTWPDFDSQRS